VDALFDTGDKVELPDTALELPGAEHHEDDEE
jgi:hypothetical protein